MVFESHCRQPDLTLDEVVATKKAAGIPGSRSAVGRFFLRHDLAAGYSGLYNMGLQGIEWVIFAVGRLKKLGMAQLFCIRAALEMSHRMRNGVFACCRR